MKIKILFYILQELFILIFSVFIVVISLGIFSIMFIVNYVGEKIYGFGRNITSIGRRC